MKTVPIKKTPQGLAFLNLACGAKTNCLWNNVDFSPYTRLRKHPGLAVFLRKTGIISDLRWQRLQSIDPDIRSWNLKKGIPWPDMSFDLVYHSHFLEHIPRRAAPGLLRECCRVLKPGGMIRISVPDLNDYISSYHESYEALKKGDQGAFADHQKAIMGMYDQFVRQEATGLTEQTNPLVRFLEGLFRASPEKTGERHQWMYDQHTLGTLLCESGFLNPRVMDYNTSHLPEWSEYGLDQDGSGTEYKPESLYMEAKKPEV